ncbi:hypothetical protein DFQ27_001958, partial [Actinomortierella ambigua]
MDLHKIVDNLKHSELMAQIREEAKDRHLYTDAPRHTSEGFDDLLETFLELDFDDSTVGDDMADIGLFDGSFIERWKADVRANPGMSAGKKNRMEAALDALQK